MLPDNDDAPKFCRFCQMHLNQGQWNDHRQGKKHRKHRRSTWPLEQQRMQEAETMLAEYANSGTTTPFVVKAQMNFSGREREFTFPNSDAPLWILEYAIRAWVLEMKGEREYLFIGVNLMLEDKILKDVHDYYAAEEPEELLLSSIFVNVAPDSEYVLKVVLDTERGKGACLKARKTEIEALCQLPVSQNVNQSNVYIFVASEPKCGSSGSAY